MEHLLVSSSLFLATLVVFHLKASALVPARKRTQRRR